MLLVLCLRINSTIEIIEHREALRTSNALEIVSKYPSWNSLEIYMYVNILSELQLSFLWLS